MTPTLLSVSEFADALADPAAPIRLSSHAGQPLIAVEVPDGRAADRLRSLTLPSGVPLDSVPGAGLPTVVAALVDDPALASAAAFADVVLVTDLVPGLTSSAGLAAVVGTVTRSPVAAAAYAMLLRGAPPARLPAHAGTVDPAVASGLALESATYSMLQGADEFARWRRERPPRTGFVDDPLPRVAVERYGHVLRLTLSRPSRRNALDTAMRDALVDALEIALIDAHLWVELRGAGASFSAGGDLDEFGSRPDIGQAHLIRLARSVGWAVHQMAGRTRVYLHGGCLGSGIEIPAFAGTVVAAPDTVIGLPEISLGLIPGAGGTVSLPRRIGRHRTAYLGLADARIDVATALVWGLVDEIAEDDALA
jgi:enoyl-CoA hydratase/carnithine racemase